MGKYRILIVEDDIDISNMLKLFFTSKNYEVDVALTGPEALDKTRTGLPHLIVLDIMLPGMDGYEVCHFLRTQTRTSHIPVIFLTQKDERSDKLQGLELGADDYITKPFDIEELKLRVQNAIARAERESLTDPRSGLPSGRLIEDQLRKIIRTDGWELLDLRIDDFDPFREKYGFVAGDDVLRFTAMLIGEVIDQSGNSNDFIAHPGGDNFLIITTQNAAPEIRSEIRKRFAEQVLTHYSFIDREQGFVATHHEPEGKAPLMTIAIGSVNPNEHQFSDIREITEHAAEARRRQSGMHS